jgi:formylglycine-generating enzyme required for sulfatase activity
MWTTSYTLTYDANGGTGTLPTDSNLYIYGQSVTVQANIDLVKSNLYFAGWNTALDGTGFTYAANDEFAMGNANVILYAKWVVSHTFETAIIPGDAVTATVGSKTFKMIYANNRDIITFPFSPGITYPFLPTDLTPVDNQTATLTKKFFIGETEVTYELWKTVYDWATDSTRGSKKYTFCYTGQMGGGPLVLTDQHPVTSISWPDAVIWCNALSEMTGAEPVYVANGTNGTITGSVLRSSVIGTYNGQDLEMVVVKSEIDNLSRKGYRLATSKEWEYTARYVGTNAGGRTDYVSNSVNNGHTDLTAGYYWTPAKYASGANKPWDDNSGGLGEPGKSANDAVAVYKYYWNQSYWVDNGTPSTAIVKSKGIGGTNALGIYDMSGNAHEWCFTDNLSGATARGGGFDSNSRDLAIGLWFTNTGSTWCGTGTGIRLAKTK